MKATVREAVGSLRCGSAGSLVLRGVRSYGHLRLFGPCPTLPTVFLHSLPPTPTWNESLTLSLLSLVWGHLFHREASSPCKGRGSVLFAPQVLRSGCLLPGWWVSAVGGRSPAYPCQGPVSTMMKSVDSEDRLGPVRLYSSVWGLGSSSFFHPQLLYCLWEQGLTL